jgi:hypothetical protein
MWEAICPSLVTVPPPTLKKALICSRKKQTEFMIIWGVKPLLKNWSQDMDHYMVHYKDVIAHAYNPSYSGGEIRRITVQGPPGQKVSKILISINKKLGMVVRAHNPISAKG